MDTREANPLYAIPTDPAVKSSGWGSEKLTGAGLAPLVKRLKELRKGGLTGEMVGKEFIRRRIAPLQAHKKDMWFYSGEEDPMQLQEGVLDDVVVNEMMRTLLADDDVPNLLN